ncbi:MAG: TIGR03960 family B12-binding radical SAM protein [Lachnospiraceae bacterium]|nr:TIGR03960 family B12-binding radical SAM protein [Lachnospiraceae bacterium]
MSLAKRLALPDDVLMKVDKAARYIGNEVNAVYKDKESVDIRIAMCFPDVYEIGMSHIGMQILYSMWNERPDTWCERVFCPWPDLFSMMKERGIRLFALESQEELLSFDLVGITLMYEMCYTNILEILDLSGIPLHSKDRGDEYPIVMGGGACSYNPEPIADFFDLFYLGEGEVQYDQILDLYKSHKHSKSYSRKAFLHEVAKIPGVYVPSLYEVSYNPDNTIRAFTPLYPDIPTVIKRQVVSDLDSAPYPKKPVVANVKAVQDRAVIEVQRGCIRGCRFCQAGTTYRPARERSAKTCLNIAKEQLRSTGYDELSLSSLSTSDHKELPVLMDELISFCREENVNISLPSLRIDAFSLDVMEKVQDVKKSSLTFAPEAGSQRLRDVINKGLSVEDIMKGARDAFLLGWNKVKLYFMLGLPTETKEDREDIAHLANEVAALYYDTIKKEDRKGRVSVNVSTSFFVPKPFTPFQWYRMFEPGEYLSRAHDVNAAIKSELNHKSITYSWHDAETSVLEGIFALGDRRIAPAIEYAYKKGQIFDAWTDYFNFGIWEEAFEKTGINTDFYISRIKPLDEILPWDFIDCGVSREFLEKEWERAKEGVVTKNCRKGCSLCGCFDMKTGVCVERRDREAVS